MKPPSPAPKPTPAEAARAKREAEKAAALRANLARRKGQQRAQADEKDPTCR